MNIILILKINLYSTQKKIYFAKKMKISGNFKIIIFLSSILLGVVVAISVILGVSLNQNSNNGTGTLSITTMTNLASLSSAVATSTRLF